MLTFLYKHSICKVKPYLLYYFRQNYKEDRTISKDNNQPLLNRNIRAKEVRLIDDEGVNHGTIPTVKALQMARERDLDLVVVSPNQAPPVAKILDWGKYKYETEKRAKKSKRARNRSCFIIWKTNQFYRKFSGRTWSR